MASEKKGKPEGKMKDFLKSRDAGTRVVGAVERYIITKPPEDQDRRSDVLHPSAMVKPEWCHRGSYYQLLGHKPPKSKYDTSLRMYGVFETGHATHRRWQNLFRDTGKLWGSWTCTECRQVYTGLVKPHNELNMYQTLHDVHSQKYKEVSLDYPPLRIAGHADGLLIGFGDPLMLEVKTIGPGTVRVEAPDIFYSNKGDVTKMWDAIKAPFGGHVTQVQIYMKLAELLNLTYQPQEAVLLYENKATNEYKEFIVPKSNFAIKHLFDAAEMICKAVDELDPPYCNVAGAQGCAQCKEYDNV